MPQDRNRARARQWRALQFLLPYVTADEDDFAWPGDLAPAEIHATWTALRELGWSRPPAGT